MNTVSSILSKAAVLALVAGTSNAAIISVLQTEGDASGAGGSGAAEIIAAPGFALDDNVTNTHMQGFDEAQGVTLSSAISIDGGSIAAGTMVDSHMIFLNTQGNARGQHGGVVWTFSGDILGIMSNGNGAYEVASTGQLGAAGTVYPGSPFSARGLESNNGTGLGTSDGYLMLATNQLRVSMAVTEPGDWIRVITAPSVVPVPAALPLLGGALGAFGLFARRRKRT